MSPELEDLVGFIAHPNPTIRLAAAEHLVPYSTAEPSIFKTEDLKPVKNLKILIRDRPKIAEHVLTILVNLSADRDVLENLATDDKFLKTILGGITSPEEPNANLLAMVLANLGKHDSLSRIATFKQPPPDALVSHDLVLNQLIDLFVKGSSGSYNRSANYDYLSYLFADLSKHAVVRTHLLTRQKYDDAIPLTKLKVFTEHASTVRRKGVASAMKNTAFDVPSHASFLDEDEVNILPYILLPLMGSEEYDLEEMEGMLPDLQLLPSDKKRDSDEEILQTHLETLTLLATTRHGRDVLRQVQVYPIIRETHKRVEHEGVREVCDRLVQVLMRGEAEDEPAVGGEPRIIERVPGRSANGNEDGTRGKVESEEEDDQIMEV